VLEIIDGREAVDGIIVLLHEHTELDQSENDLAEVPSGGDPPVLQNRSRHQAPPVEGKITTAFRQFPTADMARFAQAIDRVVQGGKDKNIRRFMIRRISAA